MKTEQNGWLVHCTFDDCNFLLLFYLFFFWHKGFQYYHYLKQSLEAQSDVVNSLFGFCMVWCECDEDQLLVSFSKLLGPKLCEFIKGNVTMKKFHLGCCNLLSYLFMFFQVSSYFNSCGWPLDLQQVLLPNSYNFRNFFTLPSCVV